MIYRFKDITKLFDPFIECGDYLLVHKKKDASYMLCVMFSGISIVLALMFFSAGSFKGGIICLSVLVIAGTCAYIVYREESLVLTIDKNGVTIVDVFYPWEKIRSVRYDIIKVKGVPGVIILFYFTNKKSTQITIDETLDQPAKVVAAYILKYHNPDGD